MSHNYRLTDFKIVEEMDMESLEYSACVVLSDVKDIPNSIVPRLERTINEMIAKCEEENAITIPVDSMELGMYIDVSPAQRLVLNLYIGYDLEKDWIEHEEIIGASDEDYMTIKRFFMNELRNYAFEKLREIERNV